MTEKKKSYQQIFKATSIFGGVQLLNIIISVVRSKFIAILLGPAGMGIAGLFTATLDFIGRLTSLGIGTSAVKNVATASAEENEPRLYTVVAVLRKLVWFTGTFGLILTTILSPWLSQVTFGNKDYTLAFIWLSVTLLFQRLSNGQLVVLQGLRKMEMLAKANVFGSLIGLFITVPLYYLWGIDGIVPAIILSGLFSLIVSWYYSRKLKIKPIKINRHILVHEGSDMVRMGILISLSGLMSLGASYIIRIFINRQGGINDVGLFNAGFAIINTYVGMVFSSMSTDYYPRLSSVANDNAKSGTLINQQAEVAVLILSPILTIFFIFINWVIVLFYSEKFIEVNGMIHWAALGMYFKAISWSIAYVFLAKGDSRLFFWNELTANIYILLFNVAGYKLAGLDGMGLSFLAAYFIYFIQVFIIANIKFNFTFDGQFYRIALIQICIGIGCFLIMKILDSPFTYIFGSILILVSTIYSFTELEKRMGLREILGRYCTQLKRK